MSQVSTNRRRRLNIRALIILVLLAILGVPALLGLRSLQNTRGKAAFLREAESRYAKGEPQMALSYINRYLELDPNNETALDLKARVLFDTAETQEQLVEAAQLHARLLGISSGDPATPERIAARRRLIRLSLKLPDRGQAAEAQARELVDLLQKKGGPKGIDASAHRLLAEALEYASETASDEPKRVALIEEARAEFEEAETLDPGDVEGAIRLAALYHHRLKDDAKARGVLDRVVASNASRPQSLSEALLARAEFIIETNGPPEAIEADIDRALAENPNNVKARMTAARVALQRRDTVTARKHIEAIPAGKDNQANLKLIEGLINLTDGRADAAIESWRAGLVASGGVDAELTWRLAQILLEVGRLNEADILIDQFRRLEGEDNARYRYLVGFSHLKRNQPAKAIVELEAVRYQIDVTLETQLQFALGQAYESLRNIPKALQAYRRATEISRDWSGPWLALAALQMASDPGNARSTLRRGLALNPTDPKLLGALVRILIAEQVKKPQDQRRWNEVEQLLADANRVAPGDPDIAIVQADYLATLGKTDDAFGLLEAAVKLRPESNDLWLALASGSARRGELGKALEWLEQGIAANGPQSGFYITRASIHVMKGDVTRARDALVEGIARCPAIQRPLLWKTLGDLYQARHDLPSARAAFEEWAKLQPENPDPRISLVLVAIESGDEPAIEAAIEAVKDVTGARGHYWRYVRVEDLLRRRKSETDDPAAVAKRLDEARTLIAEIRRQDPDLPLGHILEGRLLEASGKVDEAIDAYRKAVALNGGDSALNPLLSLIVRENRENMLDELRRSYPGGAVEFDRLAAVQALRAGNKDRAEQLAALAVQGDPQGVDVRTWQAEVLQALGKPAEAEAALNALIQRKPTEPAPWIQLLMLQVSQRRKADAIATIERMRARVKTDFPELLQAQCYRAAGDLVRATESYDAALRRWPNDLGVLLSAVGFYQQFNQPERAEAILRKVLERDPSNALAKRRLAESLAGRVGNRAAWEEAVQTIGAEPRANDVPDDLLTRARVFSQGPSAANRKKAIAILESLVAELPGLDQARELLARLYYTDGQKTKARDEIAKVADGPRPTPDAVLFHAALLLEFNAFDEAESRIERLAQSAPDNLPVAELRSRLLASKGQRTEAAKPLETAFDALPEGPARLDVGTKVIRALLGINQPEAAERVARKLADASTQGRGVLAQLLAGQGRGDEAAAELATVAKAGDPTTAGATALTLAVTRPAEPRWLELADGYYAQTLKSNPDSVDTLEKVALLRHLQKRHEDEVATYKLILDKNPSNFLFLNNLAWTLAVDMGRPDEAVTWADQAVEKAGPKPEILDTRGVILTRLSRFDEAIRDLQAAVAESPSASFLLHLALAYQKKGNLDQAKIQRDRAREAGLDPAKLPEAERDGWNAVKDL